MTPVVVSWSGGKDSAMALQHVLRDPRFAVAGLLTTITTDFDRISIHGVRTSLLRAQCDALGQRLLTVQIPALCPNAAYEAALTRKLAELRAAQVRDVVFGDLFLEDVRAYRERLVQRVGMRAHFPLWQRDTAELARGFIRDGFRATLVCVDTTQLPARFCGREFDHLLLQQLPSGCDPCGERGEFHTFVHDGPLFAAALPLLRGETVQRDTAVYIDLMPG